MYTQSFEQGRIAEENFYILAENRYWKTQKIFKRIG